MPPGRPVALTRLLELGQLSLQFLALLWQCRWHFRVHVLEHLQGVGPRLDALLSAVNRGMVCLYVTAAFSYIGAYLYLSTPP